MYGTTIWIIVELVLGGPGGEASSYAWQIALNLTDAVWFAGLGDFDILGECSRTRIVSRLLWLTLAHPDLSDGY